VPTSAITPWFFVVRLEKHSRCVDDHEVAPSRLHQLFESLHSREIGPHLHRGDGLPRQTALASYLALAHVGYAAKRTNERGDGVVGHTWMVA
jgi:hypothetical protein